MSAAYEALLQHHGIWRMGSQPQVRDGAHLASGHAQLDAILPGGGWPLGALVEIVPLEYGIGELSLLLPAMASMLASGRGALLVDPPFIPYAPALLQHGLDLSRLLVIHLVDSGQALWAMEQSLRTGACGAVLAWCDHDDGKVLRRLQLAAETGQAIGVLYRSLMPSEHSPCALRLSLEPEDGAVRLRVLKARGSMPGRSVRLDMGAAPRAGCVAGEPDAADGQPSDDKPGAVWPAPVRHGA